MDLSPPFPAPPAAKTRGCFEAVVSANVSPCTEHFRLTLKLDFFPPTIPGQFVQLMCRSTDASLTADRAFDWDTDSPAAQPLEAFLRRPFSLAGRHDQPGGGGVEIDIIHRVIGVGTSWLAELSPGEMVSVLGPLGNGFTAPDADRSSPLPKLRDGADASLMSNVQSRPAHPEDQSRPSPKPRIGLLVGGGVGIPPMLYLAAAWAGRPMIAFAGALRRELLPLTVTDAARLSTDATRAALAVAEFSEHNVPIVISTDDGSLGRRGLITHAVDAYLDANRLDRPVIYTCGPEPMLKAVAALAARRGLDCQVAVERAMACGMGTCQSCCIRITKPDPAAVPLPGSPWAWRLACTDGPVFEARHILW